MFKIPHKMKIIKECAATLYMSAVSTRGVILKIDLESTKTCHIRNTLLVLDFGIPGRSIQATFLESHLLRGEKKILVFGQKVLN